MEMTQQSFHGLKRESDTALGDVQSVGSLSSATEAGNEDGMRDQLHACFAGGSLSGSPETTPLARPQPHRSMSLPQRDQQPSVSHEMEGDARYRAQVLEGHKADSSPSASTTELCRQFDKAHRPQIFDGAEIRTNCTLIHSPRPVAFTNDTQIWTTLHKRRLESLLEIFSKNVHFFLRPRKLTKRDLQYPIGVLLWNHPRVFQRWFMAETGAAETSVLNFEVYKANWTLFNSFFISATDVNHFRMLRQYLWDYFWITLNSNQTETVLKVMVEPTLLRDEDAFPAVPSMFQVEPPGDRCHCTDCPLIRYN
jgi:hypothetical protein